jgi:SHS2 domain-containing protein
LYGYFDHDADVGVFGRGATIEQALENAARATFALMWEPRDVAMRDEVEVEFEEADAELALFTWLNALLGQAAARRLALVWSLYGAGGLRIGFLTRRGLLQLGRGPTHADAVDPDETLLAPMAHIQ